MWNGVQDRTPAGLEPQTLLPLLDWTKNPLTPTNVAFDFSLKGYNQPSLLCQMSSCEYLSAPAPVSSDEDTTARWTCSFQTFSSGGNEDLLPPSVTSLTLCHLR